MAIDLPRLSEKARKQLAILGVSRPKYLLDLPLGVLVHASALDAELVDEITEWAKAARKQSRRNVEAAERLTVLAPHNPTCTPMPEVHTEYFPALAPGSTGLGRHTESS